MIPASSLDTVLQNGAKRSEGRIFALTLAAGFVLVALVAHWRGAAGITAVASTLAAISLLGALLVPGRLGPVMLAWMKLGTAIGYVTTPILLALVYYAVITPIALLRRVVAVARRRPEETGWHRRQSDSPPARMERQF